jgi:hypothetical protein
LHASSTAGTSSAGSHSTATISHASAPPLLPLPTRPNIDDAPTFVFLGGIGGKGPPAASLFLSAPVHMKNLAHYSLNNSSRDCVLTECIKMHL